MTSLSSSPSQLLEAGQRCQQRGDLARAEMYYRQALRLRPDLAEAYTGLGILLAQRGDPAGAEGCFRQAVRLKPSLAQAHSNLGIVLHQLGRLSEAEACHRQGLRLQPDFAAGHNNLGLVLATQDRLIEAEVSYHEALRWRPDFTEAHNNLEAVLIAQGKKAEASGRKAVRLRPGSAAAHNDLGQVLVEQGKSEEALTHFREALRLKPGLAEVHNNLGIALALKNHHAEAERCFRESLRIRPDRAGTHNNLGIALHQQDRLEEALTCCQQALRLAPDYAEAHTSLGLVLQGQGRHPEALACFDRAVQLAPEFADGHWNRALALLLTGNFAQGWPAYEWRWKTRQLTPRSFPQPCWDGSPLAGRTILLHSEQGLGDTLQFVRYAPLVKLLGGNVVLECPPELVRILHTCAGISQIVTPGTPLPPFDIHCPLQSLPLAFGTTLETIPASIPYLAADSERMAEWRARLATDPAGFRVGLVWSGRPKDARANNPNCTLAHFAPLAAVKGITFYSLQKGIPAVQAGNPPPGLKLIDPTANLVDFADTAGLIANLDLVISVDTSVVHLAGALGKTVWVVLPAVPDFRWLLGRADSPWYPSLRLFRQDTPGDWQGVFARMPFALQEHFA